MSTAARTSWLRELVRKPFFWGLIAILALLLLNVLKDPNYLAVSVNPANGHLVGNVIDILRASAPILMIAVGMSLVIATGGIDLSVGSVMAVSGAVSMVFMKEAGQSGSLGVALGAIGLSLLVSALLGAINGVLVAYVRLQPFISTLIMMLAGRGIAKVITEGQNTSASNDAFRWVANGFVIGLPVGAWVDRLPARRVMIASDVAAAAILASVPVACGGVSTDSWPYFRSERHFMDSPAVHLSQSPQALNSANRTRSPGRSGAPRRSSTSSWMPARPTEPSSCSSAPSRGASRSTVCATTPPTTSKEGARKACRPTTRSTARWLGWTRACARV
jgi:hypothetical protein